MSLMTFCWNSENTIFLKRKNNTELSNLKDLSALVGGRVIGNADMEISGVSEIQHGLKNTISFISNPQYKKYIADTAASAIIAADEQLLKGKNGIIVSNPQLAFAKILSFFYQPPEQEKGIHPSAVIHTSAIIGRNVNIGPYAVIEKDTRIGDETSIGAHVVIGAGSQIGNFCTLHSNIHIYHRCIIGDHCTIASGTVIGCDGFGYITEGEIHYKIPQTGTVRIGSNVDIGANCTIDRSTISETVIGDGSKLDNLVHIAHNVKIGEGCLFAAQVGIAGSVEIGNYCIFAGQSGVVPHVKIGNYAVFAVKSGATKSLPGNTVYAGMPAREIKEQNRKDAILLEIEAIKKRLLKLEL